MVKKLVLSEMRSGEEKRRGEGEGKRRGEERLGRIST